MGQMEWFFKTEDAPHNLIIRVTLGAVIFPHGAMKLFGWFGGSGVSATLASFSQNFDIPAFLTLLVIGAESVGALCIIAGLATRLCALAIFCDMIGAVYLVHWKYGFFMNWFGKQNGEGFEYHLLVMGMALALMVAGAGAMSIDGFIVKKFYRKSITLY
jgi:putative oxidoreductase